MSSSKTTHTKEIIMHAPGDTPVWETHSDVGRTTNRQSWYQQLKAWWAAHKAARQQANLAAPSAGWNATHETFTPPRAEAAIEMAMAQAARSLATQPYGFAF